MDIVSEGAPAPGLVAGLANLAKGVFGLLVSRMELAALELSDVRDHIIALMAVFALAALCSLFALLAGCAIVVVLAWPSMGWTVLLALFLLFAVSTVLLVAKGRTMLREDRIALPETMNELKRDREALL